MMHICLNLKNIQGFDNVQRLFSYKIKIYFNTLYLTYLQLFNLSIILSKRNHAIGTQH